MGDKRAVRCWLRRSAGGSRAPFYLWRLSRIYHAARAQWLSRRSSRARWYFSPRPSDDSWCAPILGFAAFTRQLSICNPGVNAAVVGLLLAAFYNPVWTSAIFKPVDFGLAILAFGLLAFWKLPPWLVVVSTAVGGEVIVRI